VLVCYDCSFSSAANQRIIQLLILLLCNHETLTVDIFTARSLDSLTKYKNRFFLHIMLHKNLVVKLYRLYVIKTQQWTEKYLFLCRPMYVTV